MQQALQINSVGVASSAKPELEVIEEEKDAPEEAKKIRDIKKKVNATNSANHHHSKMMQEELKSNSNQVKRFFRIENVHEM